MSGKTIAENVIMDARSVCRRAHRMFAELIGKIDGCILKDSENDPNLTEGLRLLNSAIEVCSDSRLKDLLNRAHAEFRVAADKDFADTTKEALKAEIMPWCDKFKEADKELEELMLKLKGNKDLPREDETQRDEGGA